eukprot:m.116753 g.116753  ORF g.116753 m.116753 type:complete len:211 (+) comp37586_c0_seq1:112-744(+)
MAKIADIVFPAVLLMLALPSQPYRLEKPWSGPEFAPFVGKCSTVVANASDVQTSNSGKVIQRVVCKTEFDLMPNITTWGSQQQWAFTCKDGVWEPQFGRGIPIGNATSPCCISQNPKVCSFAYVREMSDYYGVSSSLGAYSRPTLMEVIYPKDASECTWKTNQYMFFQYSCPAGKTFGPGSKNFGNFYCIGGVYSVYGVPLKNAQDFLCK